MCVRFLDANVFLNVFWGSVKSTVDVTPCKKSVDSFAEHMVSKVF